MSNIITPSRFIKLMQKNPITWAHILRGVSEEQAKSLRDGGDGWNIVEVMCHIRDFEVVFFERAQQIVNEDNPTLTPRDHETLVIENDYASQSLAPVFADYQATRGKFNAWLAERSPEDWTREGVHPVTGSLTLLDQVAQVALHELDHMEQVSHILND